MVPEGFFRPGTSGCLQSEAVETAGTETVTEPGTAAMGRVYLLVLAACLCVGSRAAYCGGKPSPSAQPNLQAVDESAPVLIKSLPNAKLFQAGSGQDSFHIVHVWGTPYEMGRAHGEIVRDTARQMVDQVWRYMEEQIMQPLNKTFHFKEWFLKDVADFGLDVALDLEQLITQRYTGSYFFEEARGLAEGAGVDLKKLLRIHMIGELTKGSCSMLGAWGGSVAVPGSLLQLRALDWAVDGPFKDFPQVTVYHPEDSHGHAFANFGWAGWIGSITGMSSRQTAISEIGVSFPDDTFGKESRFGTPFTYLLRDILQFDETLEDAMTRISTSHRTCDLILGVGDGKSGQFRGIEYSAQTAKFFTDSNMEPQADWHPRISDVVYYGMDWLCPGYSEVLAKQISGFHGNLTALNILQHVVPITQTGNMQVAVYDLTSNLAFLSNARASYESGPLNAYERQYVRLNMTQLFMEQRPTVQAGDLYDAV